MGLKSLSVAIILVAVGTTEANFFNFKFGGGGSGPPPPPPIPHFFAPPFAGACGLDVFIHDLSDEARKEFFSIEMNSTLTKAEITEAVKQWLQTNKQLPTGAPAEYSSWQTNLTTCKDKFKTDISSHLSTPEGRTLFEAITAAVDDQSITRLKTCERVRDALNDSTDGARQDLRSATHAMMMNTMAGTAPMLAGIIGGGGGGGGPMMRPPPPNGTVGMNGGAGPMLAHFFKGPPGGGPPPPPPNGTVRAAAPMMNFFKGPDGGGMSVPFAHFFDCERIFGPHPGFGGGAHIMGGQRPPPPPPPTDASGAVVLPQSSPITA